MLKHLLAMAMLSTAALSATPAPVAQKQVLAEHRFSLDDRYANTFVNEVFKDNILLTLGYMKGIVKKTPVTWGKIEKPFSYSFTLKPKQTFAFHDNVLPGYKETLTRTTHADFSSDQGFKSDGYLTGDGVCHLASLMNWVARDAGLQVEAPTNHNFARIPDVPREYGVAIYDQPDQPLTSARQNLYITNNQKQPIRFTFTYKDTMLAINVRKEN